MISGREKGKKWSIPFTKRRNVYCRAVPNWVPVLYTRRTHGEATVTAVAVDDIPQLIWFNPAVTPPTISNLSTVIQPWPPSSFILHHRHYHRHCHQHLRLLLLSAQNKMWWKILLYTLRLFISVSYCTRLGLSWDGGGNGVVPVVKWQHQHRQTIFATPPLMYHNVQSSCHQHQPFLILP